MPAYNLNLADPQTILRILLTIVEASGGCLEFHSEDYDKMERSKLLTVDYDRAKGVNTLRVLGSSSAVVSVAPEAHSWTQPPQTAPLERARSEAAQQTRRSTFRSDEELAVMEEEAQKKQALAQMEKEGKAPLRINIKS